MSSAEDGKRAKYSVRLSFTCCDTCSTPASSCNKQMELGRRPSNISLNDRALSGRPAGLEFITESIELQQIMIV